jgi:hypothetical protein
MRSDTLMYMGDAEGRSHGFLRYPPGIYLKNFKHRKSWGRVAGGRRGFDPRMLCEPDASLLRQPIDLSENNIHI